MHKKILSSAVEDLSAGSRFYQKQGEGLGAYSLDSLFSDIDSLALFGGVHAKVYGCHRMLSKRFPYAIYYLIDDNDKTVVVRRVLDLRQDLKKTEKAFKNNA